MGVNTRGPQDARNVRTGKDGALYLISDNEPILLSNVNEFRFTCSFQNTDWQPVSNELIFGVPTGRTLSLTVTDTVIRDDLIMAKVWEAFNQSGVRADSRTFDFQTLLEGANGKNERIIVRGCIPDGDVDFINITPGEIVSRAWTFRCNADPVLLSKLEIDY